MLHTGDFNTQLKKSTKKIDNMNKMFVASLEKRAGPTRT